MIYYQVQYQKLDKTWEPYGEALNSSTDATWQFGEFLNQYSGDQVRAVRIVSVWQRWDKVWSVKEVLEYKDLI